MCAFQSGLPQGAPTSPKLANLACANLDARIHGYSGPRGIIYTRYADDITLSAESIIKLKKAEYFLRTIIPNEDLKINEAKIKLCGARRQKKVTGLVISNDSVRIGRLKYREIRSRLHRLFSQANVDENVVNQINGLLAYIYSVDIRTYKKIYTYIHNLQEKYKNQALMNLLHKEKIRSQPQKKVLLIDGIILICITIMPNSTATSPVE